eukprot:5751970-Pleurochrysis_carterae.AAC.2
MPNVGRSKRCLGLQSLALFTGVDGRYYRLSLECRGSENLHAGCKPFNIYPHLQSVNSQFCGYQKELEITSRGMLSLFWVLQLAYYLLAYFAVDNPAFFPGGPWLSTKVAILAVVTASRCRKEIGRRVLFAQQTVAATTVARQTNKCCENGSCVITTSGQLLRAHDYTVTRKAASPVDQDVAVRFGVSTQHAKKPHQDAYMPMPKHANAKTCNGQCAYTTINLGIYHFIPTYVTVAARVDRARSIFQRFVD